MVINLTVVGHIPQKISRFALRHGHTIKCTVDGSHQFSSDIPKGGHKIRCGLTFTTQSS